MFVENFIRVECQGCGASYSVVEDAINEEKYEVLNCTYCGDEDIDTENEIVEEE